jgi:hypothetical protein
MWRLKLSQTETQFSLLFVGTGTHGFALRLFGIVGGEPVITGLHGSA